MTVISIVLGVLFAFIAVGSLGIIALFISCDLAAAEEEKKSHENKENH